MNKHLAAIVFAIALLLPGMSNALNFEVGTVAELKDMAIHLALAKQMKTNCCQIPKSLRSDLSSFAVAKKVTKTTPAYSVYSTNSNTIYFYYSLGMEDAMLAVAIRQESEVQVIKYGKVSTE